ncbi:MAG TPA: tetratricopeptide repeat protein [Methanobacteriaceae archaeon]|nr:tetratricopeptide repeat protein [Methanobacteriaceae archaeon]
MSSKLDSPDVENGKETNASNRSQEDEKNYQRVISVFNSIKNNEDAAENLLKIGNAYGDMGKPELASDYYKGSLEIFSERKDDVGEAFAFLGLGKLSAKHGRFNESREYYEKAILKFRTTDNYVGQAIALNLIGRTYQIQGATEDALISHKQALEYFKEANDIANQSKTSRMVEVLETYDKSYFSKLNILVAFLIMIIVSEFLISYQSFELGFVINLFILFALLASSSLSKSYALSNLLRSMIVLPLIRLVSLTIPILEQNSLYLFPIISVALFSSAIVLIKNQGLNRKNVGLVWGNIPLQLLIALTGPVLGAVEYLILRPSPLVPAFSIETLILGGFIIIISTGFAEELLFRGLIQQNAEKVMGAFYGLLYTSIIFTAMHIGWQSPIDILFVFGVSMFYGYLFQSTRSLFGISLSHGLANTFLFLVMPFFL